MWIITEDTLNKREKEQKENMSITELQKDKVFIYCEQ